MQTPDSAHRRAQDKLRNANSRLDDLLADKAQLEEQANEIATALENKEAAINAKRMEIDSLVAEFANAAKAVAPQQAPDLKFSKDGLPEELKQCFATLGENADKILEAFAQQARDAAAAANTAKVEPEDDPMGPAAQPDAAGQPAAAGGKGHARSQAPVGAGGDKRALFKFDDDQSKALFESCSSFEDFTAKLNEIYEDTKRRKCL